MAPSLSRDRKGRAEDRSPTAVNITDPMGDRHQEFWRRGDAPGTPAGPLRCTPGRLAPRSGRSADCHLTADGHVCSASCGYAAGSRRGLRAPGGRGSSRPGPVNSQQIPSSGWVGPRTVRSTRRSSSERRLPDRPRAGARRRWSSSEISVESVMSAPSIEACEACSLRHGVPGRRRRSMSMARQTVWLETGWCP
jgi:hypothetical protein